MNVRATAASGRGQLRRRFDLRRAITNDFPLKAAALAIALIAWFAAAQTVPRDVVAPYPGRVPVERPDVPAGYVLRGQLGDVAVKLRGPEPAIAKLAQQDLHATIDISAVDAARQEVQDVPVRVTVSDPQLAVVQTEPATIPVRLERYVSRMLAVQLRFANDPPRGFQPGAATLSSSEVKVSGPESLVGAVAAAFATLRFGDTPVDVSSTAQAVPVDAAGVPVDGVQVEPAAVQVTVPVLSTASTRTVPVLWAIRGTVAPGYWISRVTTDPQAVTVRGDQEALGRLDRIETAPVDVSGLSATRTFRVSLVLPDGVSLLQPSEAVVGVTVVAVAGTRPFPLVAIQVTGLAATLAADTDQRTVDLVLAGPVPVLAALSLDAVSASVDASGKGAGTYAVDVAVRVPPGVTIQSVQPVRVTLTIRQK